VGAINSHTRPVSSAVERYLDKVEVVGSIPTRDTTEAKMSEVKQVLVIRKDLNMRKGKMIAQGGHSVLKFLIENNESDKPGQLLVNLSPVEALWLFGLNTKVVCSCDSEQELHDLVLKAKMKNIEVHTITDAGRTEFHGVPTLTCAAFGPDDADVIDQVTGHLKLL
jgi:peptidyl-tRNA hydrolase, PTH2 family